MRNVLTAAIVAAIVAAGSASAATLISGRSIRPGSIPLDRLSPAAIAKLGGSFNAASLVRVAGPKTTVAPATPGAAIAMCPKGTVAVGGGGGSDYADLDSSEPSGSRQWSATFYNYDQTLTATAQAFAICAKGGSK